MTDMPFVTARDTRREGMLVGGTNKKKTVRYEMDVTAKDDVVGTQGPCLLNTPNMLIGS